jgi:hypothetical protein
MTDCTLDQAIRGAIESELAAMRFFQTLAFTETSADKRELYLKFGHGAQQDADKLEGVASRVEEGEFAHYAEIEIGSVSAAPSWVCPDNVRGFDAVPLARDFAYRAAFFYDLLAEASPIHGPLFRELAALKEELAHQLQGLLAPAGVSASPTV